MEAWLQVSPSSCGVSIAEVFRKMGLTSCFLYKNQHRNPFGEVGVADFGQAESDLQSRWFQKHRKTGCSRPPFTLPCFLLRSAIWRQTAACFLLPPKPAVLRRGWRLASLPRPRALCVATDTLTLLHLRLRSSLGPTRSAP